MLTACAERAHRMPHVPFGDEAISFFSSGLIMSSSQRNARPLRQRATDRMRTHQRSPKTQDTYLRIVRELPGFPGAMFG